MGRLASVLSFGRRLVNGASVAETKCDPDGGAVVTPGHYAPPGDDSPPLHTDTASLQGGSGEGEEHAVGYQDSRNPGTASAGEKRLYSRDAAGEITGVLWLRNDGTISATNAGGAIELNPSGVATVTGTTRVFIDSPDVRVGSLAGRQLARVGDAVAVYVPTILAGAQGMPCVPLPPTAVTSSGGILATGQIISGSSVARSG